VVVTIGDKVAKVVEVTENLLTVLAPTRFDIFSGITLDVTVSNKYAKKELLVGEKILKFSYYE
jgi:hypothetical protein